MIRTTLVYKTVASCNVKLDLYRPDEAQDGTPAVVWIHGGALIFGDRTSLDGRLGIRDLLLEHRIAVVAIDYRLAPETKLPDIVDDLRDAFEWVRLEGPTYGLDPDRIGVVGHSAGGYLSLLSAYSVAPKPRAVVSFYGYGDITGPWYSQPSPHYCKEPLVSEAEALSCIGEEPLSEPADSGRRQRFYLYLRQQGLWPQRVSGMNPASNPSAFEPWNPILNVSPEWPPVLLLHGTADTDVPYERSVDMALALASNGVPNRLVSIAGGSHGFDRGVSLGDLRQENPDPAASACAEAVEFVVRHLRAR